MQFINFLLGLIFAIALALFAVFNDIRVNMTFSPVHDPVELPLYLIGLGFMAFGFLWGGFNVWINAAPSRGERRKLSKRIQELEGQIETMDKGNDSDQLSTDLLPSLPKD